MAISGLRRLLILEMRLRDANGLLICSSSIAPAPSPASALSFRAAARPAIRDSSTAGRASSVMFWRTCRVSRTATRSPMTSRRSIRMRSPILPSYSIDPIDAFPLFSSRWTMPAVPSSTSIVSRCGSLVPRIYVALPRRQALNLPDKSARGCLRPMVPCGSTCRVLSRRPRIRSSTPCGFSRTRAEILGLLTNSRHRCFRSGFRTPKATPVSGVSGCFGKRCRARSPTPAAAPARNSFRRRLKRCGPT